MKPGAWVSWVIHAKWSPENDGLIKIWKDGEAVFESKGPNLYGTIGTQYTPYLKTGIHHPEWNLKLDQHKKRFQAEIPGIEKKEIFVSDVIVGSDEATFDLTSRSIQRHSKAESGKVAAE